jgi:membrane protease YdiL (CAAX protease family)
MNSPGGPVNQKTKEWITRHPLEAFFLLGIALCFATLFPAVLVIPQEGVASQILSLYLARIAVYSPVLVGMFVARIIQPGRQRVPLTRRLSIFLPVWFIASIVHTASLNLNVEPGTPLVALVVLSIPVALLPAYVLSAAYAGADGVRQMLATLVRPKGSMVYYLIALLTFPVIHVVGTGITNILNGDAWFPQVSQGADLAFTVLITFFSVLLFSGGINEESGWRGFAQNRLQGKYSPLVANLILWFLMVIWHIPNDLVQYKHGGYILVRFGLYPFITILFGWIYNRAKGSILASAIFHASMNSMNPLMGVLPITTAGSILLIGLTVVIIVSDRMWRRLPRHHPAVYQEDRPADSTGFAVSPARTAEAQR